MILLFPLVCYALGYAIHGFINDINDHFLQFDKTVRELKLAGGKLEEMDMVINLMLTLQRVTMRWLHHSKEWMNQS